MAIGFETTSINNLAISNRFIRSATGSGMADQVGNVTSKLTEHIMELVEGEVGLIISGHICVHPTGQNSPRQLCLFNDSQVPSLKTLVKKVHEKNGKIAAQLNHGGAHANPEVTKTPTISSSVSEKTGPNCRPMDKKDIEMIVSAYQEAAVRSMKAGFDGVQLHGAHGYLLSQFLSPLYNEREDEYGGNVENRARITVEAYEAIREAVGPDYPVMIKMNVTDFIEGGTSQSEAVETASIFDQAGFDSIELSGGVIWGWKNFGLDYSPCKTTSEEAYYLETSRLLKKRIRAPVILTGGIKSFELASKIIEDGDADYIGLCRPLIREPDLVKKWKTGDYVRSKCINDGACLLSPKETTCPHR